MALLIFGVFLWWAAHLFKRLAPEMRASLGDRGKGLVAVILFISIVCMVVGFRAAAVVPLYAPVAGIGHLNNLLMLAAVFLMGVGAGKGMLSDKLRHPMLLGTLIFALAHLLVNGDLASLILFGSMALWAVMTMRLISRAEGAWQRPAPGSLRGDLPNVAITLVIFVVAAGIHFWTGHSPFLGTY
ncbi:MAG: hypothetical protein JKX69_07280 [Rhodobacteraceae bacterium]|nr:hypothetical protein [Paracoccaceae bacterium]